MTRKYLFGSASITAAAILVALGGATYSTPAMATECLLDTNEIGRAHV